MFLYYFFLFSVRKSVLFRVALLRSNWMWGDVRWTRFNGWKFKTQRHHAIWLVRESRGKDTPTKIVTLCFLFVICLFLFFIEVRFKWRLHYTFNLFRSSQKLLIRRKKCSWGKKRVKTTFECMSLLYHKMAVVNFVTPGSSRATFNRGRLFSTGEKSKSSLAVKLLCPEWSLTAATWFGGLAKKLGSLKPNTRWPSTASSAIRCSATPTASAERSVVWILSCVWVS